MGGELNYCRLSVTLELTRPVNDQTLLFGLRAGYPEAFRRVAGCGHQPGREAAACPGCVTFGQLLSSDPETVRRHQKPPLPFAFGIPLLPVSPGAGTFCELQLTLLGPAVAHAALHLAALRELFVTAPLLNGGVRVVDTATLGYQGELYPVADDGSGLPILSLEGLGQVTLLDGACLHLCLESPLLLLEGGRPAREFDIARFLRALMRRVSSLVAYYGEAELPLDFRWLSTAAGEVVTTRENFHWAAGSGRLAGLVGEGVFQGVAAEFVPLLAFGELVNLGKGASYGQGRFRARRP